MNLINYYAPLALVMAATGLAQKEAPKYHINYEIDYCNALWTRCGMAAEEALRLLGSKQIQEINQMIEDGDQSDALDTLVEYFEEHIEELHKHYELYIF